MKPLLCLLLILPMTAFAQKKSDAAADPGSDKMDLKKLEDKYWSAKETDMSVVQNRTYTKAKRFFGTLSLGTMLNDPYSSGSMTNLAVGYYFNERWGVEYAMEVGSLRDNASSVFMQEKHGTKPNYNTFEKYQSINAIFVPFYAKMSFMDRAITYFDIQIALGIGQMAYQTQIDPAQGNNRDASVIGYNLDLTQQLFFSNHFAFRLDLKNKWTKQDLSRYRTTAQEPERSLGVGNQQDTTLHFGLTFFY